MNNPAAAAYDRLRCETAAMLGLNLAELSLVQGLQLDLVSLLRLEVDGLQGQVLAGQPVDLSRLATSLKMLQELLPESALVAREAAVVTKAPADARERLAALLHGIVAARDAEKEHNLADAMEREEAVMEAEAFTGQPEPEVLPLPADGKVVPLAGARAAAVASPMRSNGEAGREVSPAEKAVALTPCVPVSRYDEPEPKRPPGRGPISAPKGNPEGFSIRPAFGAGPEPWRGWVRPL
jgi:hypothetical protein